MKYCVHSRSAPLQQRAMVFPVQYKKIPWPTIMRVFRSRMMYFEGFRLMEYNKKWINLCAAFVRCAWTYFERNQAMIKNRSVWPKLQFEISSSESIHNRSQFETFPPLFFAVLAPEFPPHVISHNKRSALAVFGFACDLKRHGAPKQCVAWIQTRTYHLAAAAMTAMRPTSNHGSEANAKTGLKDWGCG